MSSPCGSEYMECTPPHSLCMRYITCSHPARKSWSIWKSRSISLSLFLLPAYLSLSLSLSFSVCLLIHSSNYLSNYLLIYQSTYLLIYSPVYLLPSYLSIYLPIFSYPSNMLIRSSEHLLPVCLHQIWPIKRYRSIPIHLLLITKSYLSTCLPSYLSTCLPCLSIYLPTYLPIHPSIHPSIYSSIYPSIYRCFFLLVLSYLILSCYLSHLSVYI